ncbi:unnamed protein product [Adineta ricciae]|uniref:Uncharacterized protein n=1 Tax=Adineta ricciae TaxID=249248 RepID=A0A813NA32_ADIRI|nr:unnamed protein product [Adineta ricciae]CAF0913037.1 unnamed protein product [Adineta ricciae]
MSDETTELSSEYETNQSSTSDDDDIRTFQVYARKKVVPNRDRRNQSLPTACCLVCSILPALSDVNCCQMHQNLLKTTLPLGVSKKIRDMLSTTDKNNLTVRCRHRTLYSKNRKRIRSRSTSVSHDDQQATKRKQVTGKLLNVKFRTNSFSSLSSSSQSEQMISSSFQRQNTIPSKTSIFTQSRRRDMSQKNVTVENKSRTIRSTSSTPELIELEPELSYSPQLLLRRIVRIKDEEFLDTDSQITVNVNRTTDPATYRDKLRPRILPKRACCDK